MANKKQTYTTAKIEREWRRKRRQDRKRQRQEDRKLRREALHQYRQDFGGRAA
jgi:hypothetical protein